MINTMKDKRLKEILNKKAYKNLMKYMVGQTTSDAEGIYEHDFMRWFNEQEVID